MYNDFWLSGGNKNKSHANIKLELKLLAFRIRLEHISFRTLHLGILIFRRIYYMPNHIQIYVLLYLHICFSCMYTQYEWYYICTIKLKIIDSKTLIFIEHALMFIMMFDYNIVLFIRVKMNDMISVLLHARSSRFRWIEIPQTFYDTFMLMYIYGVAFSTGKSFS